MMTTQGCAIDIIDVSKYYAETLALDNVSLQILNNEFFTLLGPSGCGKTTMLRIIAGFEEANQGEIFLFGEKIETLPPHQRPINTVFQSYALFPHMSVFDNVIFGLRMLKVPKNQAIKRTNEMLELVKLSEFSSRRPAQLSGGQKQRVALARALAPEPKVLLLDESLSALDLKLRQAMRVELKQIQRETGITFIFVTHDQDEAMTMSDRIAVMSHGSLQQVGSPHEIYEKPCNRFVADFIGEVNLLPCTIKEQGRVCVIEGGHTISVENEGIEESCYVAIRPEKASLADADNPTGWKGVVECISYIGAVTEVQVRLAQGPIFKVYVQNASPMLQPIKIGDVVSVVVDIGVARLLRE